MLAMTSSYKTKEEAVKGIAQIYREYSRKPLVFAKTDNLYEPWIVDYEERDYSYAWFKVLEDHNYEIETPCNIGDSKYGWDASVYSSVVEQLINEFPPPPKSIN